MISSTANKKQSLLPILTVNFVGTLGFSIVLPFLIFLVTRFGGNAVVYGILGATYSAFQLFGAPILGRWSDRYGRRKILLLSQAGTLLSWLIFMVAMFIPLNTLLDIDSRWLGTFTLTLPLLLLFIARALDGITGGNVSVAYAYLSDITDKTHRSENFGRMAVAANLGFIFGPAIAGLLGATAYGEKLPVLATITISITALFIIGFLLPESKTAPVAESPDGDNVRRMLGQEQKDCFEIECQEKLNFSGILQIPQVPLLLSIYFLVFLGFNLFYVTFPVHVVRVFNWELIDTGAFFSFFGFCMVVVQGPILKRLSARFADRQLIISGSFILIGGFLLYYFSNELTVYFAAILLALGNGIMWPSVLATLSNTSVKHQGTVQGYAGSAGSLASIVGLIVGGVLYEYAGSVTFLISSVIFAAVFLLVVQFLKSNENEDLSSFCKHMQSLEKVVPSGNVCQQCVDQGDTWVHLRICLECGHVGCCDSSKNKHATKHYHESKHYVVQSFEPNETWLWCYLDRQMAEFSQKLYEEEK